uniref:Ribosomal protein S16 n=1 Tax=Lupinus micranthus TaxID=53230 RepID=A0A3Q8ATX9_LUPMC|nr:ribosomal protein S16 [Lupinus micranthus]
MVKLRLKRCDVVKKQHVRSRREGRDLRKKGVFMIH